MSGLPANPLMQLLPAVHQIRDAGQQQSLQQLLQVVHEQVQLVHEDIDQLYNNWFIETCDDWVVPYIADLVGFRKVDDAGEPGDVAPTDDSTANRFAYPRREVASTVRLRRRKGTLSVLEDLAFNVAGWHGRAVDFGQQILTTPHAEHLGLACGTTPDFRDTEQVERIGTPFNTVSRTPDFRTLQTRGGQGWFGPRNVGLFVWQRPVFPVTRGAVRCLSVEGLQHILFSVHPVGVPVPLHVRLERETDVYGIAQEHHLPVRLTRWLLAAPGGNADERFYGAGKSVWIDEATSDSGTPWATVSADRVVVTDLSCLDTCDHICRIAHNLLQLLQDHLPMASRTEHPAARVPHWISKLATCVTLQMALKVLESVLSDCRCILLDPETGRMLAGGKQPHELRVSWHYGSAAGIGGGAYRRAIAPPAAPGIKQVRVHDHREDGADLTLVNLLNSPTSPQCTAGRQSVLDEDGCTILKSCTIEFASSLTWRLYQPDGIVVSAGTTLTLRARRHTRPVLDLQGRQDDCGAESLPVTLLPGAQIVLDGMMLTGDPLEITFQAASDLPQETEPSCSGETVVQRPSQQPPADVVVRHCTLLPRNDGCDCGGGHHPQLRIHGERGRVSIRHSIVQGMEVDLPDCARTTQQDCPVLLPEVAVCDSIITSGVRGAALASTEQCFADADLTIQRSTVLGDLHVQRLSAADDSIFCGLVRVRQTQHGHLRYCYVPRQRDETVGMPSDDTSDGCRQASSSATPPRFRCQPDLWQAARKAWVHANASSNKDHTVPDPGPQPRPRFYSTVYGHPGFGQLTVSCPQAIAQGAESESEMGAFHSEFFPQRRSRLTQQLSDFTPSDMQSAVIYAEELNSGAH